MIILLAKILKYVEIQVMKFEDVLGNSTIKYRMHIAKLLNTPRYIRYTATTI